MSSLDRLAAQEDIVKIAGGQQAVVDIAGNQ